VNVVDSCGWLEYFANGPNAQFFAEAIEHPADLLVPSITAFEVFRRLLQQSDEQHALLLTAQMQHGEILQLDVELALAAARIGQVHRLPLADAVVYASAQSRGATLWTQDGHFRDLPGVRYTSKA